MPVRPASVLLVSLLLCLAPSSLSAKPAAMRVPPELAPAERWSVSGRQGWRQLQRLTYGPVRVFDVQRSLTKGGDLQILFYRGSKRRQTFRFAVVENGGAVWQGEAATNLRRRAGEFDGFALEFRNKSGFAARLAPVDRPADAWTLELTESSERPLEGKLSAGAETVVVKGTNRLAGTPLPLGETSGYVFEWDNRAIAAVEVINDGAVWLSPDLPTHLRAPVLAAVSALLLFEELRPTLPG